MDFAFVFGYPHSFFGSLCLDAACLEFLFLGYAQACKIRTLAVGRRNIIVRMIPMLYSWTRICTSCIYSLS